MRIQLRLVILDLSRTVPGMLRELFARYGEEISVNRPGRLHIFRFAILAGSSLLLSGCGDSRGGPIPYNVSSFGVPDSPEPVPLEAGYRIAPMDTVTVKVFKMPDLTGDYEVDLAGHISMPLIMAGLAATSFSRPN